MKDSGRFGPLVSALVVLPLLGALGLVGHCGGVCRVAEIAALCCYLAWLILEVATASVREISLPPAPEDRRTLERCALAQVATAIGAVGLAHAWPLFWRWVDPAVSILGAALVVLGGSLRLWAMATLGRWYSRRVRVQEGHQVVTRGPFRLVRHPAYLGNWVGHLGLGLAFQSPVSLLVCVLAFLPGIIARIHREDEVLRHELPGYACYAARTARLLPGVW